METLPYEYNESHWDGLAKDLESISRSICDDNQCTEGNHNCESQAYIAQDGTLVDIGPIDFFQGWCSTDIERHGNIASIPLPWNGTGEELREEVDYESWIDEE